jgi:hypothetical protein
MRRRIPREFLFVLLIVLVRPAAARQKLRVGMMFATMPPWVIRDPSTGEYTGGFHTLFYTELGKIGGYDIEFVAFPPEFINDFTGTVTKLLDENKIDLGWDSPSTNMLVSGYLYSPPMVRLNVNMATKKTVRKASYFQVFAPFENALWGAMIASIFFGAFVLCFLQGIVSAENGYMMRLMEAVKDFPGFFYHTFAAMLGGDEYDLYHSPWAGRVYRLGLLWLVLITSATYTANLAAYLTKKEYIIHGPRTLEDLKRSTNPVCWRWPQYVHTVVPFVREKSAILMPPSSMAAADRIAWGQQNLQNGTCDAILDINVNLKPESLGLSGDPEACHNMHLNQDAEFGFNNNINIMRWSDRDLYHNVSQHILALTMTPQYTRIIQVQALGFRP